MGDKSPQDQAPPPVGAVQRPFDSPPEAETTNTALKRIPLTATVAKVYPYFSDWLEEFGEHVYPQGMFIPTPQPKAKGALVKVDFRTDEGAVILAAVCEVVRSDEALPGALSGMWVGFKVIEPAYQEMVTRVHQERERRQKGPEG